ncbi:hypothetical protein [Cryptosporangium sp. NPDC051539]|uniref:hypothetical protein n=1 Tax=Cryptosporangium sp. NPDC051539 TaxID=3363962 RepID=UPI0037A45118
MSYADLMRHAADIRDKAALETIKEQRRPPYDRTGNPRTADERRDTLAASRKIVLAQGLAEIPSLFQPFAEMPDPAGFLPMRDRADDLAAALSGSARTTNPLYETIYLASLAYSEMADVRTALDRWHGPAANAFRANFLSPFPFRLGNQFVIALLVRGALDAEREIWTRARTDIDQIAHGTMHALDALDDCSKFEWTMTFTVLASVAATAAVPLSAGGSLALAVALVGGSSQVIAAYAPEDPTKSQYTGKTVDAVLDNMREAITKLRSGIHLQETKVANVLRTAVEGMRGRRDIFVAPRPDLIAATRATIREDLGDAS